MSAKLKPVKNDPNWSPTSWQKKTALQQANYPDAEALDSVVKQLSSLPPLVTSYEIDRLRSDIAEAQRGERFILQGGDCAESLSECNSNKIAKTLKVLLQMSLVMRYGMKLPVSVIGRMAGQYAKPRSADLETIDGITLPSYRGDLINKAEFTEEARIPDPELLLQGYQYAGLTINFVRSLIDGGFSEIRHADDWDLDFAQHSTQADEVHRIVESILDSIGLFETFKGEPGRTQANQMIYTSHEGLHLHYEQAQTRFLEKRQNWYNLSTHMPWIGARTADVDHAHVEYMRGIRNPIGIKLGPAMTRSWLYGLLDTLNPENEEGRIVLIHRFGANKIEKHLPELISAVQNKGAKVLWMCDPMHGNTESTADGTKTRRFDNIAKEVDLAFKVHKANNSRLGGVHFELTGEDVTECTGGARGLADHELSRAYKTQVDPRLNYEQALELALRIIKS